MAIKPPAPRAIRSRPAIAWSNLATVGDIALANGELAGDLEAGLVECRLTPAGKFRNGAERFWCASHQAHWGVKADRARADGKCRGASVPLSVAIDPLRLDLNAISAQGQTLFLGLENGAIRVRHGALDAIVPALALAVEGLFARPAIIQLNITAPALAAMRRADGCVDCSRCGFPHLDLGSFAQSPHRRHLCGHCGHDALHSGSALVSNPIYALRERLSLDWGS